MRNERAPGGCRPRRVVAAGLITLAGLAPLAAQAPERQVATVLNCLRQPDGERLAAPVLRLVQAGDRPTVAEGLLRTIGGDEVLRTRFVAAATAAPSFGVVLFDVAPDLVDPEHATEREQFVFFDAVLPLLTAEQLHKLQPRWLRAHHLHRLEPALAELRADCRFRYELREAQLVSRTADRLHQRMHGLCNQNGLAGRACRMVAQDAQYAAVEARLLADHDRDDGILAPAVERFIQRARAMAEPVPEWPDDPLVAQALLLARRHPLSRPGRWGLLASFCGADPVARGAALQQLLLVPPRAAEWRLVWLLALRLEAESPATVRAFLAWAAAGERPELVCWPVLRAAESWAPELRQACRAAFGRNRSPRDEVVQALSFGDPVALSLTTDLAIEWLGQRLQRLVKSLQHLPSLPIPEAEADARLQLLYGDWQDLAGEQSGTELAERLDRHLAAGAGAAPRGLLPRLLAHCLAATGGDAALARAVGLAVLTAPDAGEVPHEALPIWGGTGLPAGSSIVVGDTPAAWQALAALAAETPFAFGIAPTKPDWAIAARFAARDRRQAMSLGDVQALASLWTEPGVLVRSRWGGHDLFAPVQVQSVDEGGGTRSRFLLAPVR